MTEPVIDRDVFRALQDSAGADFVAELVATFLEELPRMTAALRSALAAGDVDAFRRTAHSLKSNSLTFGAKRLGGMARALELDAAGAVERGAVAPVDALAEEQDRVAADLRELARA